MKPTKSAVKSKAKPAISRHSDEKRASIIAFIKGGKTNHEAKAKFGVSAHFVGKLRKEANVGPAKAKPVAAKAPAKAVSTKSSPKPAPAKGKATPKAKPAPKALPADAADAADVL